MRPSLICSAVLALVACSAADARFPRGFLFGTAVAGFQVEMGCPSTPRAQCEDPASDWYQFITDPALLADQSLHLNGDAPSSGPGFYQLYAQDLDLAANQLHSNALRLSFEWSRIFPSSTVGIEGFEALSAAANPQAVAYYHSVLRAIRARGMRPLVTLNHYTLPGWIHDAAGCHADLSSCKRRGWVDRETTVNEIAKYAGFAAREFGGEVDLWATLNEPFTGIALAGYILPNDQRTNPPGVTLRFNEAKIAILAMMEAHNRMADAVHANDLIDADGTGRPARVGLVYNVQPPEPRDPGNPRDVQSAKDLGYLMNEVFLNGALRGDVDAALDGHTVHRDDLAHRTDFFGLNYYVRAKAAAASEPLFPNDAPKLTFDPSTLELIGDAAGLTDALQIARGYGLPIFITETGIGDESDTGAAAAWIGETLSRTRAAISQGVPVEGWFFWTLMDNYEWNHGMSYKFGLYAVDKGDPAKTRRPREKAIAAFAAVAQSRLAPSR